jgi:hypothetical protein
MKTVYSHFQPLGGQTAISVSLLLPCIDCLFDSRKEDTPQPSAILDVGMAELFSIQYVAIQWFLSNAADESAEV